VEIPGASSSTYFINEAQVGDSGTYFVEVSNGAGTVSSIGAELVVLADHDGPLVRIQSPKTTVLAADHPEAFKIEAFGTAVDAGPAGTVLVEYSLNGAGFVPAAGTDDWSATLTPLNPGFNTLVIRATDGVGNQATLARTFNYRIFKPLTVSWTGQGEVKPNRDFAETQVDLELGRNYKMTARPDIKVADYVFTNWTSNLPDRILSNPNEPKLLFAMAEGLELTANFIPNPFTPVSGVYNALFHEMDGGDPAVSHHSAGFATIKVSPKGSFSGKLFFDGDSISMSGKMDLSGTIGSQPVLRVKQGKPDLAIDLALEWNPADSSAQSDRLLGTIHGPGWTAELEGFRSPYNKENHATDYAGNYTMVLQNEEEVNPEFAPNGYGYSLVTVRDDGRLNVKAAMADGVKLKPSSGVILRDGRWAYHGGVYLHTNIVNGKALKCFRGSIMGWVAFDEVEGLTHIAPAGDLTWIKTGWTNTHYAGGFTNQVTAIGSKYIAPAGPGLPIIAGLEHAAVTFLEGNLEEALSKSGPLSPKNALVLDKAGNLEKVKLGIAWKTGLIKGGFIHPDIPGLKVSVAGVLLHEQKIGLGHFLGNTISGSFVFSEAPPDTTLE
jgi:hypothetical protein